MSRPIIMTPGVKDFVPAGTACRMAAPQGPDPAEVLRLAVERARREAAAETEARLRAEFAKAQEQEQRRWAALEQRLQELLRSMEKQIAEQLIRTSVKVAETLLRRPLPDAAMVEEIIRETLSPISDLQGVKVRLHPVDAARVIAQRNRSDVPAVYDRIEIVADPSLAAGDVMMESRNGYFDARLAERLSMLEEKLMQRHRSRDAGTVGH